jgi:RNA polymerase sigma-70 factor, ECF subfamily
MSNPAVSVEPYRRRLLGLAYRMLGSMADAEDAVQETYVRWHAADRETVSDPRAYLMTTTRICLDMLTSARARREEYVGPWLPEPVVDTAALAPDSRTELAEDLSMALLLTLDRPVQTAAFEIDGDVIRALYVVRNSDKLRHLTSAAAPLPDANGRG